MSETELSVIRKTYDLVKWSCEHTSKFPRNYRFVLGERIERKEVSWDGHRPIGPVGPSPG
jgi:hypothetical protein